TLPARLRASARARMQTIGRRLHALEMRPAFAGVPGRVAMRGRQTSELTFALANVMRSRLAVRERRIGQIRRQLENLDLGRRLAGIRTRLVGADGRLSGAIARRRHRADAQLR